MNTNGALAVDQAEGWIFFSNHASKHINVFPIDSPDSSTTILSGKAGNMVDDLHNISCALQHLHFIIAGFYCYGLAADTSTQNLYYTHIDDGKIGRVDYDGQSNTIVVSSGCGRPQAIDVDIVSR